jgi:predicted dehydrogenase
MSRLLVISDEPERWQAVEARLSSIAIEWRAALTGSVAAFDIVVIAKSVNDSKGAIEEFLRAGKPVLWAADIDLAWHDVAALHAVAQQSKAQLAIVNPERFLPSRQLIKQQIPDKMGQAGLVRIHRWESTKAESGSMLRDLDLALWLMGRSPDRVFAVENRIAESRIIQVHLGFPGGGMALIDNTNSLPAGDGYEALSVIGSSGAAYADDHQNMQLLYRGGRPQAIRTEEGIRQSVDMVQWFADALKNGSDLSESVRGWQSVFAVHNAIKQSLTSKQSVRIVG